MGDDLIGALAQARNIAIFLHIRPDGDTVGSGLALSHGLRQMGKSTDVFCDDEMGDKFDFLAGYGEINRASLSGYDLLIAVDCSDDRRLGAYGDSFIKSRNNACIDHHRSNNGFAKYNLVLPDSSSTAEIMTDVIARLGISVTPEIADCLYTGLSTDTGNFCHSNTRASTLAIASRMVESGADPHKLTTKLYRNSSRERTLLLGRVLTGMRFYEQNRISILAVRKEDIASCGADMSDTEGFIDFGISIAGVEVAVCLLQVAENSYKVSFRSSGLADVCRIASVFGGGGHTLASGCQLSGNFYDVLEKLLKSIKDELAL